MPSDVSDLQAKTTNGAPRVAHQLCQVSSASVSEAARNPTFFSIGFGIYLSGPFSLLTLHVRLGTLELDRLSRSELERLVIANRAATAAFVQTRRL